MQREELLTNWNINISHRIGDYDTLYKETCIAPIHNQYHEGIQLFQYHFTFYNSIKRDHHKADITAVQVAFFFGTCRAAINWN